MTPRGTTLGPRHLVLVGMMGAGKSTVGRVAAERLARPFVDTDALIEERAGLSVSEIFASEGETSFRDLESAVLEDVLASAEPAVVAVGGGAVVRPENRDALRRHGARVVWLCADPAVLADRVRSGAHRPLLATDPEATLRRLAAEREAAYRAAADAIVGVDGRSVHEVVEAVLR